MKVKIVLLFLLLFVTNQLFSYNAYINGIYYNFSGSNAVVTYKNPSGGTYSGAINIPQTVSYNGKKYNVTEIGEKAFYKSTEMKTIVIPSSITKIGNKAFHSCSGLQILLYLKTWYQLVKKLYLHGAII